MSGGRHQFLDKLENVVVDINVSGSKESMRVARPVTFKDIKGEGIFAPDPNLESLNAFPETVEILVLIYPKELASKTVPIKVSASGQPAKGMMVQMVTPIPNQVKLLGDAEVLKGIQYVSLGTIDINGLSSNKVADFLLNSVTLPKGVSFSEGTKLSVMVYIVASPVDKIIKDIPVEIKNLPQGLTSTAISPIEITVNGNPDILNTLKTGDISAWVDATDLKAGTYPDVTVYWSAPAGVSVIQVPKVELVLQSKQ